MVFAIGGFAAGIWLPLVWWRPGALLMEFGRWENKAFLALVVLVAWARPVVGATTGIRAVRWAALALAAVSVAGVVMYSFREMEAPRTVLVGVGVGALVVSALTWWPWPPGKPAPVPLWWPEGVLLIMALTTWVRW